MPSTDLREGWQPDSWRARPASQQPDYPDAGALGSALEELHALPPLVKIRSICVCRLSSAIAASGSCSSSNAR